ncbi:hypothetical protein AAH991_37185 [Microbispora sp. ZYX-F-249]|uniref:Uncharacterized protein n=1 Tax=Microbispora maris TaxID=3144104 RepID=A0ABV0B389_9ACTN
MTEQDPNPQDEEGHQAASDPSGEEMSKPERDPQPEQIEPDDLPMDKSEPIWLEKDRKTVAMMQKWIVITALALFALSAIGPVICAIILDSATYEAVQPEIESACARINTLMLAVLAYLFGFRQGSR